MMISVETVFTCGLLFALFCFVVMVKCQKEWPEFNEAWTIAKFFTSIAVTAFQILRMVCMVENGKPYGLALLHTFMCLILVIGTAFSLNHE